MTCEVQRKGISDQRFLRVPVGQVGKEQDPVICTQSFVNS